MPITLYVCPWDSQPLPEITALQNTPQYLSLLVCPVDFPAQRPDAGTNATQPALSKEMSDTTVVRSRSPP